jgi:2-polyprenyl-3-methyl-5-hydroxy-6-metoxy-1,4-benzoquinol methylase
VSEFSTSAGSAPEADPAGDAANPATASPTAATPGRPDPAPTAAEVASETATSEPVDALPPAVATDHYSKSADAETWWQAHFEQAAGQVIEFLAGDGISLEGKSVADIGCGDGILDLGVAVQAKPDRLVGFDILSHDVEELRERAETYAGIDKLPDNLFFATSEPTRIPAEDDEFDYVISWSAFEHIADPVAVLDEVRRVLRPHGVLFIQLWPFYHSSHGTHLVDWFPEGFAQFRHSQDEILRKVRSQGDQQLASDMIEAFVTLNEITADGLQDALRQAGFRIVKVALSSEAVHIPAEAAHLPLSQVAISGIKLLAIADGQPVPRPQPKTEQPGAEPSDDQPAGQPRHAEPTPEPDSDEPEAGSPS